MGNTVLDPSYSVLLGEPECDSDTQLSSGKSSSMLAVIIAVPVVVVSVIVITAVIVLFVIPKAKLYQRVKSEKKKLKDNEMDNITVEKVESMEVNTVAGNFVVKM